MSPTMNNFFEEMLEAAKAREALPQVQHELEKAKFDLATANDTITNRESSILSLKAEIEALHAKVREAEAGRDNAETMFLEESERTSAFRLLVASFVSDAEALRKAQEPPAPVAPEPTPEAVQSEPAPSDPAVVSDVTPEPVYPWSRDHNYDPAPEVAAPAAPTVEPSVTLSGVAYTPATPQDVGSVGQANVGGEQGQSANHPIHSQSEMTAHVDTTTSIASHTEPVASMAANPEPGPALGPYFGKRYHDHPVYVSRYDWLTGGGTHEDYDWRPSRGFRSTF